MVRFVPAEHVVDQVGVESDLPPSLLLTRVPPLDQAGDDGDVAKRALQKARFGHPGFQVVAEHVLGEQRSEEHTSELQSLMRISYAVFCLQKKRKQQRVTTRDNAERR